MAGAGYKLFNTGDVLTAQQVNEYLMQQTVMVFADASARTTALSGVLAEGMLSYLKSTDQAEVYNGSAWVALASDQTPLTTKGDLFTYTTADARLASSNVNGDVLTVDTSTATGLKWAAPATGGITLIQESVASSNSSISFTSIPQTYKQLLLVWAGCYYSTTGSFDARINNDSTGLHVTSTLQIDGTSISNTFSGALTTVLDGNLFGYNQTSTSVENTSRGYLLIDNYISTTRVKNYNFILSYRNVTTSTNRQIFGNGFFNSTSAITQLDIVRASGTPNLTNIANTSIRLYGVS